MKAHFDGNAGFTNTYRRDNCTKAFAIIDSSSATIPKYAAQAHSQVLNAIKQLDAILTYKPHQGE